MSYSVQEELDQATRLVQSIVAKEFEVEIEVVGENVKFKAISPDSLELLNLSLELQRAFKIDLSDSDTDELDTPAAVAGYMITKGWKSESLSAAV